MNLIKVVNGKTHGFVGESKIYIGRKSQPYSLPQSPLHNPYIMGKDGDRREVCQKFDLYLWKKVKLWSETGECDDTVMEIKDIACQVKERRANKNNGEDVEDIELTCYCHPWQCHGDGIIRCVNWILQQGLV
ncbi:DUF4326 domain-containing protein [Nostoc sp. NMS8]|uniref:DUF4326 domain-containing protein n=1 Tax=Nostoc sp. NMS8 TaxID=2815392 RepID=UPI0025E67BC7|nr:DUF4326 domain-containing protein [Nostoc sp. NMS8]MBN3961753.1 DUF4326 domain-containing protein [Nostoc sp. NMS8]